MCPVYEQEESVKTQTDRLTSGALHPRTELQCRDRVAVLGHVWKSPQCAEANGAWAWPPESAASVGQGQAQCQAHMAGEIPLLCCCEESHQASENRTEKPSLTSCCSETNRRPSANSRQWSALKAEPTALPGGLRSPRSPLCVAVACPVPGGAGQILRVSAQGETAPHAAVPGLVCERQLRKLLPSDPALPSSVPSTKDPQVRGPCL